MANKPDDEENNNEYYDEDLELEDSATQGEGIQNPDAVNRIFNTEILLENIRRTMLGYKIVKGRFVNTGKGIARSETVDKMVNSLRAVINTESFFSYKDDDEIKYILLEKAKENIYRMYDDPMVDEDDIEHISNMLDHPCEMFMGIVKSGDGSEAARQILSGSYQRLNESKNANKPAFRVGTENFDFFSVGGKR